MLFSRAALACVGALASLRSVMADQEVHRFDWTLGWKTVNPDGLKDRIVVAINDQWPLPVVRINRGDRLEITVHNELREPERNSSIHWHGLYQNGTTDMDGASWTSQCAGAPGSTFLYNFTIEQNGTYWYHAHVEDLYPDGYRQMILVDNDDPPFEYDEELSFSLSDWYHELIEDISNNDFMSLYNPTGAEPVPQALLFNDTTTAKLKVKPNTTYRLRIANTGAFSAFICYINGHKMKVVEVDGVYTEPAETNAIYISAAQRYSVLFTTGPDTNTSYQFEYVADIRLYDVIPPTLKLNNTAWFVTSDDAETTELTSTDIFNNMDIRLPDSSDVEEKDFTSEDIDYFDDFTLVPADHMPLLPDPDTQVTLKVSLTNLMDGVNYAFFNDITYTHAKVPTLYTVLSAPSDDVAMNSTIYGTDTHTVVVDHMKVVELVLNNFDSGPHPFHLHGHHFQVLVRAESKGADDDSDYYPYDPDTQNVTFPEFPMRRDTLVVQPYSHFVIRFLADNPGVWLFHCHIEWHLRQGLIMQFVEAPRQVRQQYGSVDSLPESILNTCKMSNIPYKGNAAAHTENFFDLSGQNLQQKDLPGGFTARGIVALVFSCICAIVGMGFLCWYGLSDTSEGEARVIERFIDEPVNSDDVEDTGMLNQHGERLFREGEHLFPHPHHHRDRQESE